jgi:glutathione synthase
VSSVPLTLAFVMDPPQTIDVSADTSFALMLEAQSRGHRILYVDPADLAIWDKQARALVRPITLRRDPGRPAKLGDPEWVVLDDVVDVAFQRVDPPVDADYVFATQILALCRRTRVYNRPEGILGANEKLYTLHFPELMPDTVVSRDATQILEFMEKMGGEAVVKPLDGRGGEGVFHVHLKDRNLNSILEQSTRFGSRRAMAQRYLPAVRDGDKRILLLEGEPLGAVLRVPAESEIRANLHVGGRAARAEVDARDREIIDRIGPRLREDGLFFVGIDVIGGFLTEVNVTSPTGIQEMGRIDGQAYEKRVIDVVESRSSRS